MENVDTRDLDFLLQMRFQIRFNDNRLMFKDVASNRTDSIMGKKELKSDLWVPHIFFVNEK